MRTIKEIADRNAAAGLHWFKPDAMRFFGSRCLPYVYPGAAGRVYFVSGERRPRSDERRAYSVRVASVDGAIDTVGEFQAYATAAGARAAAARAARADIAAAPAPAPMAPGPGAPAVARALHAMGNLAIVVVADDDDVIPNCPTCGGSASTLGKMGNRYHHRCRACGIEFSIEVG